MSHPRSVFKSTSSAPPSKSARELRVEKFDADRTAVISALQASKNVDPPSLEIAPVPGPDAAGSDETFLSNLERLTASAPVQRDDLADRVSHPSDVPIRPIDSPLVSQFVRAANHDFVPNLDLGNASTSIVVVQVDEDPIVCSSSTPTRQVRAISLVSTQMPKTVIPLLAPPAPFPEISLVSSQGPKNALPISTPLSGFREVQPAIPPPPLTSPRLTASSKKTLTSPKRLKVLKHSDGWSEIQGRLTPAGMAPVVSNDIRKFMSTIPMENRFQALSKMIDTKPRAAIPQHISKKLSHTRDKTPKRDVEEVRAIATSRAIVSDSPASDSSSSGDDSFVTDDSDPSYKDSSSTSSGTRRERKKKNRLAAATLARTQRTLERHQAKQFGARLKALAASRGIHTVAERIDACVLQKKLSVRKIRITSIVSDIQSNFLTHEIVISDEVVFHSLVSLADVDVNGVHGFVVEKQEDGYFIVETDSLDKFSVHFSNFNVRNRLFDDELIAHLLDLLSHTKLAEALPILSSLIIGNRNPMFQIALASLAQSHARALAPHIFRLVDVESKLWDSAPSHSYEPVVHETLDPTTLPKIAPQSLQHETRTVLHEDAQSTTRYVDSIIYHGSHPRPRYGAHSIHVEDQLYTCRMGPQTGFFQNTLFEYHTIGHTRAFDEYIRRNSARHLEGHDPSLSQRFRSEDDHDTRIFRNDVGQQIAGLSTIQIFPPLPRSSPSTDEICAPHALASTDNRYYNEREARIANGENIALYAGATISSRKPSPCDSTCLRTGRLVRYFREIQFTRVDFNPVNKCRSHTPLFSRHRRPHIDGDDAFRPDSSPHGWLSQRELASIRDRERTVQALATATNCIIRNSHTRNVCLEMFQRDSHDAFFDFTHTTEETLYLSDLLKAWNSPTAAIPERELQNDISAVLWILSFSPPEVTSNFIRIIQQFFRFRQPMFHALVFDCLESTFPDLGDELDALLRDTIRPALPIGKTLRLFKTLFRPGQITQPSYSQAQDLQDIVPGASFDWACLSDSAIADEQARLVIVSRRVREVGKDFFTNLPICPNVSYTPLDKKFFEHINSTSQAYCLDRSSYQSPTSPHDHFDLLMNLELIFQMLQFWSNPGGMENHITQNDLAAFIFSMSRLPILYIREIQRQMKRELSAFPLFTSTLWLMLYDYRIAITPMPTPKSDSGSDFDDADDAPPLPRAPTNSLESRVSTRDMACSTVRHATLHPGHLSALSAAACGKCHHPHAPIPDRQPKPPSTDSGTSDDDVPLKPRQKTTRLPSPTPLQQTTVPMRAAEPPLDLSFVRCREGGYCKNHCNSSNRNPLPSQLRSHTPNRDDGPGQPRIPARIPTLSPPSVQQSGQQAVLVMPQEKAPRLTASISDIPNVVRTFLPLYRIYSRAYARQRLQFQTIFECFSEQQQRTLQLSGLLTYDMLMALSNDELLDQLKALWGLKTPASTLQALRVIKFQGDSLDRDSWILLQSEFAIILDQAAQRGLPSEKELAKAFIALCPFGFMRQELTNANVRNWESALHKALELLNDVEFVREASKLRSGLSGGNSTSNSTNGNGNGNGNGQHRNASPANVPIPAVIRQTPARIERQFQDHQLAPQRFERQLPPRLERQSPASRESHPHANNSRPATPFIANLRGNRAPERVAFVPSSPYPSRSPNPQQSACTRCGMNGHDSKSCVRNNHVDGSALPKLDEAEYSRRRALIPSKSNGNRVALIRDADQDDDYEDHDPVDQQSPTIGSPQPLSDLLEPPLGCGFILNSPTPPATGLNAGPNRLIVFAVDSRCESNSVIKSSVAKRLKLNVTKCAPIISSTATCEQITCTQTCTFILGVFINHQYNYFEITAMVWPDLCDDLIICNSFALSSNLIRFVLPQNERLAIIGRPACSKPHSTSDFQTRVRQDDDDVQQSFWEEVMCEDDENMIDLAAPLMFNAGIRFSDLSKENQEWARLFPNFLLPFPEHSHPDIPEFDAHVLMDKVASYSSSLQQKKFYKPIRSSDKAREKFANTIAELRGKFFVSNSIANPHGVASIAHLIPKPNGKERFVVNCSGINKCLEMQMYPLPTIQEAHAFVGKFKCFATLDLESGYFNMSIKPESRWITRTIGPGFAIEWLRCTQGLAPMVSFFQWAMSTILIEFKDFAFVYLDDVVIGGITKEEVSQRLHAVLQRLHDLNFRISFKKSQLSPSFTFHFLGRTFANGFIVPGPNTSILLSKMVHPGAHSSDKHARTALRSFLGAGNYLRPHMPNWTVAVAPLYAKGNQTWTWTSSDQAAWDAGMNCLKNLKPLELPSINPDARFEIFTDASDIGWAGVLFQRQHADTTGVEDLRLIQWDGGSFSAKQCEWTIHQREMFAVYQMFKSCHHWIRLHPIILYIDNMVLTYMDSSENPMIQRWFSFIQDYNFSVFHVRSEDNPLADAFSRLQGKFADQACIKHSAASASAQICSPILRLHSALPAVAAVTRSGLQTAPPIPKARTKSLIATPQPLLPLSILPSEQLVSFTITVHDVATEGACCPESLLKALRHLYAEDATFPFPPVDDEQHLRDTLLDYIELHATVPCSALSGLSFKAGITMEYIRCHRELRDSAFYSEAMETGQDPHQFVSTFAQYLNAMRRPTAYGDEFMIAATAMKYYVDIVVAHEDGSPAQCFQSPSPTHRLFLTQDADHYKWAHVSDLRCFTCSSPPPRSSRPISITFSLFASVLPPLRVSPPRPSNDSPPPPRLTSIDDSQVLSAEHALWITTAHCASTGHPGRDATVAALRRNGHSWRGMFSSVSKFIDRCPTCQISRRQQIPLVPFSRQISCSTRLCRRWHVDLSGSYPLCATRGHQFVILFVDELSGFCFLRSAATNCALEVAMSLLELSSLFGIPDSIHSDGGSEFDSDIVSQFCALSSVRHNLSIARAPNSNGIAERHMREAKRVLRMLSIDFGRFDSWSPLLPITQRALNSRYKDSMGCSPQEFVFGSLLSDDAAVIPCEPAVVHDAAMADANAFHPSANFMHRALRFQEATLQRLTDVKQSHITAALFANSTISPSSRPLLLGELVLIPWRDNSPPSSLHPKLCGPYIVEAISQQTNTIDLVHTCNPPPKGQQSRTSWTLAANVFRYDADLDSGQFSTVSALGQPLPRAVDCIVSCELLPPPLPLPATRSHVLNHRFLVRWLNASQLDSSFATYDAIRATFACDSFCASHPSLTGHSSVLREIAFDPRARPSSERPSHAAVSLSELQFTGDPASPVTHRRRRNRHRRE
jgi:transposase InsO family protein